MVSCSRVGLFFEPLALLRAVLIEHVASSQVASGAVDDSCEQLWAGLSIARQLALTEGTDAGEITAAALELPASACRPARTATALALLTATTVSGTANVNTKLLQRAEVEAGSRWPAELLLSPWPALLLLGSFERRALDPEDRLGLVGELRGAVAYVHFRPKEMLRFHDLNRSLASLQRYWLNVTADQWPVIVFADNASAEAQETALRALHPSLDLRVVVIDEADLEWPMPHEHPFCSQGYRRAARFTAGPLYMHKALDGISHLLLVDTEFEFTHPVPWDPLRYMYEERAQLGYWQTHYEQTWNRTVFLTEISREFMKALKLEPQVPELVRYWWDYGSEEVPGGSFPVNIYGCLFAGAMSFFRSEIFQAYFHTLDQWPGWSEHCWSPQSVLAIAAGFFLSDTDISELWIFGRHQNSTKTPDKGWNRSGKGVLQPGRRADTMPNDQHIP